MTRPTVGGYPSSDRPASDLAPPPRGPAPGARKQQDEQPGENVQGHVRPPTGRYFDGFAHATNLPTAEVVELHLSFGGKAQVSGLPDNTGFLIRVFPPGAPHEEGGGNHTDLSVVIRYDESLRAVIEGLHLWRRSATWAGTP